MAEAESVPARSRFGATLRRDAWWLELLPVVLVLGLFGDLRHAARAFEGRYYEWGPYLSPFYSPLIDPEHRWWPFSPALLILGGPLGFRAHLLLLPEGLLPRLLPRSAGLRRRRSRAGSYRGETTFPFILQNLHRYFLYLALLFLAFLWYDAVRRLLGSTAASGSAWARSCLTANVVLLSLYTFSCHSLRHLVGGKARLLLLLRLRAARGTRMEVGDRAERAAQPLRLDEPSSRSGWPISTSGRWPAGVIRRPPRSCDREVSRRTSTTSS